MTEKWHVVIEYDEETGHFAGTVPGLSVYVDGLTYTEVLEALKTAIPFHLEGLRERGVTPAKFARVEVVEV